MHLKRECQLKNENHQQFLYPPTNVQEIYTRDPIV